MNILGNNPTVAVLIFIAALIIVIHIFEQEIVNILARVKLFRLRKKYNQPKQIVRRVNRFEHTNYVYGFGDEIKEKK